MSQFGINECSKDDQVDLPLNSFLNIFPTLLFGNSFLK